MNFEQLGLIRPILDALAHQGYETPSPIQEQAIPAALAGRDVLGCARTGTGKTCAFSAPILQRLFQTPAAGRPIRALILTPTRELAIQIQENIEAYGANLPLKSVVIFGGVGQNPQVEAIQAGCDILVATPGRLEDLHGQGLVDLGRMEIFVLDEADRMLDMGFIHDVKKILAWLPKKKQTLFFSATMPKEISALVDSLLHDPVKIAVDPVSSPVEVIRQSVYFVDRGNKTKLLAHLIREEDIPSALVFTRTKHGANKVARDLEKEGLSAAAIHGNKSQTARQAALSGFKDGSVRVLVATDIAARGIDIEELPFVCNYNLPEVPETYVHRIGRTGRAGHEGVAVSLCDFGEKPLLRDIEKLIRKKLPVVEDHPWPMQVFEAPVKDARGKIVNPEDAEARAAARARRAETNAAKAPAAKRSAPEPAAAPQPKKAKVQVKPLEQETKQPEEIRPAPAAEAPRAKAATDVYDPDDVAREEDLSAWRKENRVFKRPERKPMSALDEIAPVPADFVMPEPKYTGVKRTGHLSNTFLPELEEDRAPEKRTSFLDATDRMFATKRTMMNPGQDPTYKVQEVLIREGSAGHSRASRASRDRQRGRDARQDAARPGQGARKERAAQSAARPAGAKATAAKQTPAPQKSTARPAPQKQVPADANAPQNAEHRRRRRRRGGAQKQGAAATPAPVQAEKKANDAAQNKGKGSQRRARGGAQGRRPAEPRRDHQKDSTEQRSLMRPYYLSDREK